MRLKIVVLILGVSLNLHGEGGLPGKAEHLSYIKVGPEAKQVSFSSDESGFLVPLGPIVDLEGALCFYPLAGSTARTELLKFDRGGWSSIPMPPSLKGKEWQSSVQLFSSSQGSVVSLLNGKTFSSNLQQDTITLFPKDTIFERPSPPNDWTGAQYLGKLASGHSVWGVGTLGMESYFLIIDSNSKVELEVYFPWRYNGTAETTRLFSYSLGPWGEFYSLIAPENVEAGRMKNPEGEYKPNIEVDPNGEAELVVVRNHLKFFGRLNDNGVRLRDTPTTGGKVIGTYAIKTGFRILETGTKQETISGNTSVWYKVRLLDGKEGWFFGAFVLNLFDGPQGKSPPWPNVVDR